MDVFKLNRRLISDYANFISGFIPVKDQRIKEKMEHELEAGLLWPDAMIQLNPAFEPGKTIKSLISEGLLHPECERIFRRDKKSDFLGEEMTLFKHQEEAIRAAAKHENYVLTTGTGSGKSLAYIIPIVNYCLNQPKSKSIKAIIVYPMNALANSQMGELEKFLDFGYNGKPLVSYCRYTGQEDLNRRQEIISNPPDILLTNYVMLELLLTRAFEKQLIKAAKGLQFVVLDELHTYRGRQGADVAMLMRRLRNFCESPSMQCIGTSATMATGSTFSEQQRVVSDVSSRIFGVNIKPEYVIGETLKRQTPSEDITSNDFIRKLIESLTNSSISTSSEYSQFIQDPLAIWIESVFGISLEPSQNRLVRRIPRSITGTNGAAQELAKITNMEKDESAKAIRECLLRGYNIKNPSGFPTFAFRLHQFISNGDAIYTSLESKNNRYITLLGQQFVPGDRNKYLYPLVLCRECGQEFYSVIKKENPDTKKTIFEPSKPFDNQGKIENAKYGYLCLKEEWPDEIEKQLAILPEDWIEEVDGKSTVLKKYLKELPQTFKLNGLGEEDPQGTEFVFVETPFRFCLSCGVSYDFHFKKDYIKLAPLSSQGRSTSTTVLSLSVLNYLQQEESLSKNAKKLLSFTDNRQDASLQAGHFNDFVQVVLIRAALYKALDNAINKKLTYDVLPSELFEALNLPWCLYAANKSAAEDRQINLNAAFTDVLAYRVYADLAFDQRITSPNLEQCGLLYFDYELESIVNTDRLWEDKHIALAKATADERRKICKTLLDYLRRNLAIKVEYLDPIEQERIKRRSKQELDAPWGIDENEILFQAPIAYPCSRRKKDLTNLYISGRSKFGSFLRKPKTFSSFQGTLKTIDAESIIRDIFDVLVKQDMLELADNKNIGYRLKASAINWCKGDGEERAIDYLMTPSAPKNGLRTNPFFVDAYTKVSYQSLFYTAAEHTAQVPTEIREERERLFSNAKLPLLFCSPTMELGVDIKQLNVVNMRNMPPTPANYAQRSGRAGRSGQPALVYTFCGWQNAHDQYFFQKPEEMVSGQVLPPRIDLTNKDLLESHTRAIWLSESGEGLGSSMRDILDLSFVKTLPIKESIFATLEDKALKSNTFKRSLSVIQSLVPELNGTDWVPEKGIETWLSSVVNSITDDFNKACDRWRTLYRAARQQIERQNKIITDASRSQRDRQNAQRLRNEAESQLELLLSGDNAIQSDFYTYRYFASEGFLPGYNFPRLPLSAYIPGRILKGDKEKEFLSRPRFLAISEFGPNSVIYHEGSKYIVNKVIMEAQEEDIATSKLKICKNCGYLHPVTDMLQDRCELCNESLGAPLINLFRLNNVSTKRKERIRCDEEERLRMGYELKTGFVFSTKEGKILAKSASVVTDDGTEIMKLIYGDRARIWRMNLGWRKRGPEEQDGYDLDIERGLWGKPKDEELLTDEELSNRVKRVIPYVEDTRNVLVIEPNGDVNLQFMATLQAAFKNAIQVRYQLEDNEIACEALPDNNNRHSILFYEASEGGAGVLRRLVEDSNAIREVAKEALAICHFDSDTGEDYKRAIRSTENCESACYFCLMSYANQLDHKYLDRQLILNFLLQLKSAQVNVSPSSETREDAFQKLLALAESSLEEEWLTYIYEAGLKLPDIAQSFISECETKPDFLYDKEKVAVYIDGPYHNYEDKKEIDSMQELKLEDKGYLTIRFSYRKEDWPIIVKNSSWLFNTKNNQEGY